jgi:hypothetical protein
MEPGWSKIISSTTVCNTYYTIFILYTIFGILGIISIIIRLKLPNRLAIAFGFQGLLTIFLGTILAFFQYLVCSRALLDPSLYRENFISPKPTNTAAKPTKMTPKPTKTPPKPTNTAAAPIKITVKSTKKTTKPTAKEITSAIKVAVKPPLVKQKAATNLGCITGGGGIICTWSNGRIAYGNQYGIVDITQQSSNIVTPWGPKNQLDPYIP